MKIRITQFALLASLCVWITSPLSAEPLWKKLLPGKAIEADPSRDYGIDENSGPWLIVATTFSGDGAEDQARDLVLELRRRYKMEAYMHEMTFDFSKPVAGRGVDRTGQPTRMHYRRKMKLQEIAVLVGHFAGVQDPEAQSTLRTLKYLQPDALNPEKRETTNQTLAALRSIQARLLPDDSRQKERGPMGHAFITRNPLISKDYFVSKGLDPLVVRMNESLKYSLLNCKAKYSVQVATFTGRVVLDQQEVMDVTQRGKHLKSRLDDAAERAHELTLALRHKGYEAFEFHDRTVSIVTVGAFNSVGTPRADGKTEINPRIHQVMNTFRSQPVSQTKLVSSPAQPAGGLKPKTLMNIPFDLQPQIVNVPKRSISDAYRR